MAKAIQYLILCTLAIGVIGEPCQDFSAEAGSCTTFIRCFQNIRIRFTCPSDTAWEDSIKTCIRSDLVQRCRGVKLQRKLESSNDTLIFDADIDALNNIPIGQTLAQARALGPIAMPRQYRCSFCNTGSCGIVEDTVECFCGDAPCPPPPPPPPPPTTTVQPINPCTVNPCLNGGQCGSTGIGVFCSCPTTFTGNRCEAPAATPCQSSPCQNGGTCVPQGSSFSCMCLPMCYGVCCENRVPATTTTTTTIPYNPCVNSPCQNGGTCVPQGSSFSCMCLPMCFGVCCENRVPATTTTTVPYNPCVNSPCQNGGTCVPQGPSFSCMCLPTCYGVCCENRVPATTPYNPCANSPCRNGGRCIPTGNSFVCQCQSGYQGTCCETRNPCMPNPCCNNGYCTPTTTSFVCSCLRPYAGVTCQDIITTTTTTTTTTRAPCGQGCACVVNPCPTAVVTNPCAPNPCQNMGGCAVQRSNTAKCFCSSGYQGYYCQYRRLARSLMSKICNKTCLNGGECYIDELNGGQALCSCPDEYYGSRCEFMNRPKSCFPKNPCMNNGRCVTSSAGAQCICQNGTSGVLCEKIARSLNGKHCPLDCQAGGTCVFINATPLCRCPPGQTGRLCEIRSG